MTKIKINDEAYSYAVYHIAVLFFKKVEMVNSNEWDYKVEIGSNNTQIFSRDGSTENYEFDDRLKFNDNIKMAAFKYFSHLTGKKLPWGTLIGIRPSKIASRLIEENKSDEEIIDYYRIHNHTDEKNQDYV